MGRELPVHLGLESIARSLLFSDLPFQDIHAVDAPVQALADHDIEFDLVHVQPTAVLRGVNALEAIPMPWSVPVDRSRSARRADGC